MRLLRLLMLGANVSVQLGADVHGHFDIGDMAFDTTFEHDYAEQEVRRALNPTHAPTHPHSGD